MNFSATFVRRLHWLNLPGAFLIALSRGALTFRATFEVLRETTNTSASLFAVLIGAWIFSNFVNLAGLPDALRDSLAPAQRVRLPMRLGQRSLNLSNAVAVAVFEAWRQQGYADGG